MIEQIKIHDNFSYIVFCEKSKKALVIDPSYNISKTVDFIDKNALDLKYIILTHYHSDHIAKTKELKNTYVNSKIVSSKTDGLKMSFNVDVFVNDNDILSLGKIDLNFVLTPGHTKGGICVIADDKALFTGDTLFIGDCGRGDLPGGSIKDLFDSLQKIKTLPGNLIVYPGHDYGDKPFDSLENQIKTNKTLLSKNLNEFSKI